MKSIVEIDQSFKFENTKEDTVIAFSNGINASVLIPARVKRESILILRQEQNKNKTMYVMLFATCLYYLLKEHIERISRVVIDIEYSGKDNQIKEHLINLLRRGGYLIKGEKIIFGLVGKQSPAHYIAIETFRKKKEPTIILTTEAIIRQFKIRKEKNRGSLKSEKS